MRSVVACCLSLLIVVLGLSASPALGAKKSDKKSLGVPKEGQALVYLIREKHFQGKARTFFVFVDDEFVGTLDNDCYTFTYVDPGERLVWLNFVKVNAEIDFEAGETYYLRIFTSIEDVGREWGRPMVQKVQSYCSIEEKEIPKANEYLAERRGKADKMAEGAPSDKHIAKWPKVDLREYSAVAVADFTISDPKKDKRKDPYQAASAPNRMADKLAKVLSDGPFDEVYREASPVPAPGAIVVRADISQYKPGSRVGRAMLAGVGSAHLNFSVSLFDSVTGEQLTSFSDKRTWAWGGAVGAGHGIEEMEKRVAGEIAQYIRNCKGDTAVATTDPQ